MATLLIYQTYTKKDYIFKLFILTLTWIVFMENFSWLLLFSGIASNALILHILKNALPFEPIVNIAWIKFFMVHFILLVEIYKGAMTLLKVTILGGETSIIDLKIQIDDRFMQSIFCMWITLIPGSIVTTIEKNHIELVVVHRCHQIAKESIEPTAIKIERILKNCVIKEKKELDVLKFFIIFKSGFIIALVLFLINHIFFTI